MDLQVWVNLLTQMHATALKGFAMMKENTTSTQHYKLPHFLKISCSGLFFCVVAKKYTSQYQIGQRE